MRATPQLAIGALITMASTAISYLGYSGKLSIQIPDGVTFHTTGFQSVQTGFGNDHKTTLPTAGLEIQFEDAVNDLRDKPLLVKKVKKTTNLFTSEKKKTKTPVVNNTSTPVEEKKPNTAVQRKFIAWWDNIQADEQEEGDDEEDDKKEEQTTVKDEDDKTTKYNPATDGSVFKDMYYLLSHADEHCPYCRELSIFCFGVTVTDAMRIVHHNMNVQGFLASIIITLGFIIKTFETIPAIVFAYLQSHGHVHPVVEAASRLIVHCMVVDFYQEILSAIIYRRYMNLKFWQYGDIHRVCGFGPIELFHHFNCIVFENKYLWKYRYEQRQIYFNANAAEMQRLTQEHAQEVARIIAEKDAVIAEKDTEILHLKQQRAENHRMHLNVANMLFHLNTKDMSMEQKRAYLLDISVGNTFHEMADVLNVQDKNSFQNKMRSHVESFQSGRDMPHN